MKKKFIALVAIATTSCGAQASWFGSNEIDLVRDGVLDADRSVTVGQLLNSNNLICANKKWEKFTSSSNRTVVEFSCQFPKEVAAFQKLKSVENKKKSQELLSKYPGVLDFDIEYRAQFIISADKKTFDSGWNDIVFCYSDGKEAGVFSALYENEVKEYNRLVNLNNLYVMGGGAAFPGLRNKPKRYDLLLQSLYKGDKLIDGDWASSTFSYTPEGKQGVLEKHINGIGIYLKRK